MADSVSEPAKRKRRMEPYTARWERLASEVARGWAPPIYPCAHCGYPVVKGYCCGGCNSGNPESKE
jgi:hypothetical protein